MDPILIVVADQARARIFMSETRAGKLQELADLANPQGRLHEGDLITGEQGGKAGSGRTAGQNKGMANRPMDVRATYTENNALERAAETFAKQINETLEQKLPSLRPARIHVMAPPQFLGLLRAKWSKSVQALIEEEIPKDVSKLSVEEIREHLPDFV